MGFLLLLLLFLTVVSELSSMLGEVWDLFIKDSQGDCHAVLVLWIFGVFKIVALVRATGKLITVDVSVTKFFVHLKFSLPMIYSRHSHSDFHYFLTVSAFFTLWRALPCCFRCCGCQWCHNASCTCILSQLQASKLCPGLGVHSACVYLSPGLSCVGKWWYAKICSSPAVPLHILKSSKRLHSKAVGMYAIPGSVQSRVG